MDDLSSVPETLTYITDRQESIDAQYMECVLMYPFDLMIIIEIDIRKNPLIRRVRTTWLIDKTLDWSLDLGMVASRQL